MKLVSVVTENPLVAQMERETGEICWKEAKTKFKDSIVDAATPAIGCAYFRLIS